MGRFRILPAFVFVTIVAYTAAVITNHGMGLLPVFFGDMSRKARHGVLIQHTSCKPRVVGSVAPVGRVGADLEVGQRLRGRRRSPPPGTPHGVY